METSTYRFNKRTERAFQAGMILSEFHAAYISSLPKPKRERWENAEITPGVIMVINQIDDRFHELSSTAETLYIP